MLTLSTACSAGEEIISKADADHIFSLDRAGWEKYVVQIQYPDGWETRLRPSDLGTVVMALATSTGYILSISPMFDDQTSPPGMLMVGSYYPTGQGDAIDDAYVSSVEAGARRDLGDKYTVFAVKADTPPLIGIDLMIRQVASE